MSKSNEHAVYTYPLPTMAHGFAIEDAYSEFEVFRDLLTEERRQAFDELASFKTAYTDRFVGTAALMQEAVAMLEVWGEAYATRRDVPPKRTETARVALQMAADLTALVEYGEGVTDTFDESAFYRFLDEQDQA